MRTRRVWQLVVLCVGLVTLALLSGVYPFASRAEPAFARNDREESPLPTPEVEEEIEPYIQMYAEAFGISYAEAKWRLGLQGEMNDLQARVQIPANCRTSIDRSGISDESVNRS